MERNVAQPSAREGNVAQRMSLLALVCVCVHEFGYKGMYVCMYVSMYVCMHVCMRLYKCESVQAYTCAVTFYAHIFTCIPINVYNIAWVVYLSRFSTHGCVCRRVSRA